MASRRCKHFRLIENKQLETSKLFSKHDIAARNNHSARCGGNAAKCATEG